MTIGCSREKQIMVFEHSHPLIFNNEQVKDEDKGLVICVWCDEPILDPFFNCSQCEFVRHTICEKPPLEIKHPFHPQHTLTFRRIFNYYYHCDICGEGGSDDSSLYNCNTCHFKLDMSCAFYAPTIEHTSHEHPLMLLQRLTKFKCDACELKRKDQSYLCPRCQFWIHKNCALLPKTITRNDHHHSLTLVYSPYLLYKYSNYSPRCSICTEPVNEDNWVYSCSKCRYNIHVKCRESMPRGRLIEEEDFGANGNLIHLPSDNCLDVIRHFVKEADLRDYNPTPFNHFSHNHPLQLFEEDNNKMENDKILLCEGCLQPIVAPFYSCVQCTYSLHKCCVELPQEVQQHPCHLEHTLFLITSRLFYCNGCEKLGNGFAFHCAPCTFYLHVTCASILNSTVVHEAHKQHSLVPSDRWIYECNACDSPRGVGPSLGFKCHTCPFYFLCIECVLLQRTIRHRWDEHPFILSYPPFTDHPEEFYCEDCEEEINPNTWMYNCNECDQSFHAICINLVNQPSKYAYGDTIEIDLHLHPLTIQKTYFYNGHRCDSCKEIASRNYLKCVPCDLNLCFKCAGLDTCKRSCSQM